MGVMVSRGTFVAVVTVVAVGLTACGGGSEDSDASAGSGQADTADVPGETVGNGASSGEDSGTLLAQVDVGRLDPDVVRVADAAIDTLGDPDGAEAIVLALERGYDAGQLIASVAGLGADGTISADGAATSPNRSRQGVVALPEDDAGSGGDEESLGAGPVGFRRSPVGELGEVDIATLFTSALENGGSSPAFAAAVVSLDESGYSLEQIIAAVLAGGRIWTQDDRCARLGTIFTPARPARVDTACAVSVTLIADEIDAVDEVTVATSEAAVQAAEDIGFEPGTFVGSVAGQSGGADSEGETLRDVIEFTAGDTLTGKVELLAYGPGPLDTDFECIYVLYDFDALQLVDAGAGRYAGTGSASAGFSEGRCDGNPPIEETVPFDVTAQVVGDTLTVTLTADGDEGSFTATRVGS